jgi:N-acetylneuraminic acid mutarotase
MYESRAGHTATVLQDGRVMVVGGTIHFSPERRTNGCELYDPLTGNWTKIASMNVARNGHTATLFKNGQVLVAGGSVDSGDIISSCELYDPSTDAWVVVDSMHDSRSSFTASLLPNGKVLVAGGKTGSGYEYLNSTELYDPTTGNWTKLDDMLFPVADHSASLLRNGDVLIAGGDTSDGFDRYVVNISMVYSLSMKAVPSSNVIAKLPASRHIFMLSDKKVSAIVEGKFKTVNNTQRH